MHSTSDEARLGATGRTVVSREKEGGAGDQASRMSAISRRVFSIISAALSP